MQELLTALDEFIRRGQATGALLEPLSDRRVAQGMLNFWANTLYRAGFEPPDATLADFDPDLAPATPRNDRRRYQREEYSGAETSAPHAPPLRSYAAATA